jgi:hypothetical protein
MVLRIPFRIQRKLPCASLFSHTSTLSTPSLSLCKNCFLHASSTVHIASYKQYVWNHKVERARFGVPIFDDVREKAGAILRDKHNYY